jgi:hypothetical protein
MQQSRMMAEALSLEPQQPDLESESLDMVRFFLSTSCDGVR